MTGVSHKRATDVVGVLQTLEDGVGDWSLRALAKLGLSGLDGGVEVLNPGVVLLGQGVCDMLLENDNVRVWDVLGVIVGNQRSDLVVEDAGLEDGRRRREKRERQKTEGTLHCESANK